MEPCTESWPWDDLVDSPDRDSFQSASTTYDPPSVTSIPDSCNSSIGSQSVLIPEPLWDHAISTSHRRPMPFSSALPPLPPKATCTSALGDRQLRQSTERRRVPRPRFRLANQKASTTRRSLIAAFDAVKHVPDSVDGSYNIDYSCHASGLIKARSEPQQQQGLGRCCVCNNTDVGLHIKVWRLVKMCSWTWTHVTYQYCHMCLWKKCIASMAHVPSILRVVDMHKKPHCCVTGL